MPAAVSRDQPTMTMHEHRCRASATKTPPRFPITPLSSSPGSRSHHNSPPDTSPPHSPVGVYPTQSTPSPPPPPPFATALSTLRRNLSSQFSLIPEDRAVHITSVSRDGFTYQFRRETSAAADTTSAGVGGGGGGGSFGDPSSSSSSSSSAASQCWRLTCGALRLIMRLLLWWPLLVLSVIRRTAAFLFTAPIEMSSTTTTTSSTSTTTSAANPPTTTTTTNFSSPPPSYWQLATGLLSTLCAQIWWRALHIAAAVPLNIAKHVLLVLHTSAAERARPKRTVLISGGSTIQALHLARNFHAAGFRVVAADIDDGRLALAGYSTAVSKYYTLPRPPARCATKMVNAGGNHRTHQQQPTSATTSAYIGRLCDIVETERPVLYIPICAGASAAHFDALAKPHLVLRGCATFCPGAQECAVLDDFAELLLQCRRIGLAVPAHRVVRSVPELLGLYDSGWTAAHAAGRLLLHVMGGVCLPAGVAGGAGRGSKASATRTTTTDDRRRYVVLPRDREAVAERVAGLYISDQQPWLVVAEPLSEEKRSGGGGGGVLVTCTTVRESRIVANVTCRRDARGRLQPVDNAVADEVERWLSEFFARVRLQRPIEGHIAFRLVRKPGGEGGAATTIVPVGVRVGVPAAYICHTGVQTRVLMPPCRHFSRQKSGPLVLAGERYWVHEALLAALRHPTLGAVGRLCVGPWLDGGEALFVHWDPLPCAAYCVGRLPGTVVRAVWRRWGRATPE